MKIGKWKINIWINHGFSFLFHYQGKWNNSTQKRLYILWWEININKDEFKPKRNLKERYSLEGIAKSKGITVDELKNQIKTNQEERKKILDKYIKKGMTTEQANRMTMLELYIPGFTGPTFKD